MNKEKKEIKTYRIEANGEFQGMYSGTDESEAILAYVRDAGYNSVYLAADALGKTETEFLAELKLS